MTRRLPWDWLFAVSVFLLFGVLQEVDHPRLFNPLVRVFGVEPYRFLFVDTDTVLSALRCRRAGVDVFAANPCDDLGRVFDYSPLWLVGAAFPVTTAWIAPVGLIVDIGFLASLLLFPSRRSLPARWIMAAGMVSYATVFALERANNDCIIFALVALGCFVLAKSARGRFVGYGLISLAGFLKYYPMVVLGLIARERPRDGLVYAAFAAVLTLGFILVFGAELARALPLVPVGSYFGDMFGASTLPGGLASLMGWPRSVAGLLQIGLLLLAGIAALRLHASGLISEALARVSSDAQTFALGGSLLVLGFFLTAQNIGYRTLHLLFILPVLAELVFAPRCAAYFRSITVGAVLLLWSGAWRHWLDLAASASGHPGAPVVILAGWLLREALWWWVIVFVMSVVAHAVATAPVLRVGLRLAQRQWRRTPRLTGPSRAG